MGWPYQQKPPLGWPLDYDSGLVPDAGLWLFNEGSGGQVFDLSGNGNDGLLENTATFIPGKFGAAVEIGDGSDGRIAIPSWTPLVNDLTMVVWARLDADKPTGIVMDQAGSTRCAIKSDLPFKAHYYDGAFHCITSSVSQVLGTWNQFVYVKSSSIGARLYLNGQLVGEEATHTSNIVPWQYLCFGSASNTLGNATYTIDGAIDHGLICNRVLTASEIALLCREPFCMFKDPAEVAILGGYQGAPPVGMAGAMTTNTGYWGW